MRKWLLRKDVEWRSQHMSVEKEFLEEVAAKAWRWECCWHFWGKGRGLCGSRARAEGQSSKRRGQSDKKGQTMESPQAIERILTFFIHRKILNFSFSFWSVLWQHNYSCSHKKNLDCFSRTAKGKKNVFGRGRIFKLAIKQECKEKKKANTLFCFSISKRPLSIKRRVVKHCICY